VVRGPSDGGPEKYSGQVSVQIRLAAKRGAIQAVEARNGSSLPNNVYGYGELDLPSLALD